MNNKSIEGCIKSVKGSEPYSKAVNIVIEEFTYNKQDESTGEIEEVVTYTLRLRNKMTNSTHPFPNGMEHIDLTYDQMIYFKKQLNL